MTESQPSHPPATPGAAHEAVDKKQKRRQLDFDTIDRDSKFLRNVDFTISAGTVTFHPRTGKVLVVLNKKYQENILQLPKGRRNLGEDLPDAAIRETHEETGYRVKLVPVRVPTRATRPRGSQRPSDMSVGFKGPVLVPDPHDKDTIDDTATEPVGMVTSTEPLADSGVQVRKMSFFYLATLANPDAPPDKNTQDKGERLEAKWMTVADARLALRFESEREALLCAHAHRTRAPAPV